MKKNELDLYLLKIIKHDGNIDPLVELGFDYFEISKMIKRTISDGFAKMNDGLILITEKGEAKIFELENQLAKKNQSKWIEPEYKSQIKKLKKGEIFVPELEELWRFD